VRRMRSIVAAALLVLALATPRPATPQFAVFDAINWVENAMQVIQQAYEIYQRYQQLVNDYQRYATMIKNLERFDELTFRNLVDLAYAIEEIIRYGQSLGHTLYDIDAQFVDTFPGYEAILDGQWLETFAHRNRRTLDTLRYSLSALRRISDTAVEAQAMLDLLGSHVRSADGNVKIMEAANELLHHQSGELAKLNQQLSLQTNIQAVYWAYVVDQQAADRATTSEWIENGVAPVPDYTGGRRGVPAGWPWPCFGCGR
jgi:P-type conjugative transfer protein TrbJ